MDELARGTWIVNSVKHFSRVRNNAPELGYFEATELAGKAATLLSRLVADESEVIPAAKIRTFARESSITGAELPTVLHHLRQQEKVDFTDFELGSCPEVEVYCFSARSAIETAGNIYQAVGASEYEEASLVSLAKTFQTPQFETELIEQLTRVGFKEEVAVTTLRLQDTLDLVRSSDEDAEKLYYNEYAFADSPQKVARALKSLNDADRTAVQDIQDVVNSSPGFDLEILKKQFPDKILSMMEGIGLLDGVTVESPLGNATFVTLPQLRGISIGPSLLTADVFHRAKVLLSCFRYGEMRSYAGRGQIDSYDKLINILNKLLRGEWVGSCRAIGQDYQLLERDGVIVTRPAGAGMYDMKLRQKEVGLLVKQMIQLQRVVTEADIELQRLLGTQPASYLTPEDRKSTIMARPTKAVSEISSLIMQSIRTGMR